MTNVRLAWAGCLFACVSLAVNFGGCPCCSAQAFAAEDHSLADITDLGILKKAFNEGRGDVRLIVLYSPTCPGCVQGAQLTQKLLEEHSEANVRVYSVWLPMLPGDRRSAWNPKLLSDRRVTHYWDGGAKVVGAWFRDHLAELDKTGAEGHDFMRGAFGNKRAAWDVYFLFGPDAVWEEIPAPLISWGRPVYRAIEPLRNDFQRLVTGSKAASTDAPADGGPP